MDYEKKYKEMVERVKAFHKEGNALTKAQMEIILPELAESEDKRISNLIYCIVRDREDVRTTLESNGISVDKALAYLEKQKEPENVSATTMIPSCWTEKQKEQKPSIVEKLREISTPADENWFEIQKRWEKEDEQKPAEWSEEDEEMLEDIKFSFTYNKGEMTDALKSLKPRLKQEWSEDDERNYEYLHQIICDYINNPQIEYKEREKASKELIPFWERLKSLRLQMKQEWSDEDEKMLNVIISDIRRIQRNCGIGTDEWNIHSKAIRWLESLRPQPHTVSIKDATKFGNLEYERGVKDGIQSEKSRQWKPSNEQMNAFRKLIRSAVFLSSWRELEKEIDSLYLDLRNFSHEIH